MQYFSYGVTMHACNEVTGSTCMHKHKYTRIIRYSYVLILIHDSNLWMTTSWYLMSWIYLQWIILKFTYWSFNLLFASLITCLPSLIKIHASVNSYFIARSIQSPRPWVVQCQDNHRMVAVFVTEWERTDAKSMKMVNWRGKTIIHQEIFPPCM